MTCFESSSTSAAERCLEGDATSGKRRVEGNATSHVGEGSAERDVEGNAGVNGDRRTTSGKHRWHGYQHKITACTETVRGADSDCRCTSGTICPNGPRTWTINVAQPEATANARSADGTDRDTHSTECDSNSVEGNGRKAAGKRGRCSGNGGDKSSRRTSSAGAEHGEESVGGAHGERSSRSAE